MRSVKNGRSFSDRYLIVSVKVEELVSNSQLNISSEEDVFTAVLNWVKHDLTNRSQYIAKVGQNIFSYNC